MRRFADVAELTGGRFGPDPMALYEDWAVFTEFAGGVTATTGALVEADLGCPVPAPRQVFAIGVNYRSHAEEPGMAVPEVPATFTKFPACRTGPFDDIEIVGESSDWEVELVAVVARRADHVDKAEAWSYITGLTFGQDVSDRRLQFAAGGQFSLGKSHRATAAMGPWVVSVDKVADPDDLALGGSVDGETVQNGRMRGLVFSVPRLVAELCRRSCLGTSSSPARRLGWVSPASRHGSCDRDRCSSRGSRVSDPCAIGASKEATTMLLPLSPEPFTAPTGRDMLPSERRAFVRTHRTCVFGYPRLHDGPALSVVYYVPTDDDDLLVSTMAGRAKARAVARNPKVSLCLLDERWPFAYLQVYADATVDHDRELVVELMMAIGGRMSGEPLAEEARPIVEAMAAEEHRVVVRCRPYATFAQPLRHLHRNDQAEPITHWGSGALPWDAPDPTWAP